MPSFLIPKAFIEEHALKNIKDKNDDVVRTLELFLANKEFAMNEQMENHMAVLDDGQKPQHVLSVEATKAFLEKIKLSYDDFINAYAEHLKKL
jgi:hypothetical protein